MPTEELGQRSPSLWVPSVLKNGMADITTLGVVRYPGWRVTLQSGLGHLPILGDTLSWSCFEGNHIPDPWRLEEASQGGSYVSPDFAFRFRLALRRTQFDRAHVPEYVKLWPLIFDTDLRGLARWDGSATFAWWKYCVWLPWLHLPEENFHSNWELHLLSNIKKIAGWIYLS